MIASTDRIRSVAQKLALLSRAVIAVLLIASNPTASDARSRQRGAEPAFSGAVVRVVDGDSIEVMRDGRAVKVRLLGIDCPEKKQPFGRRAKERTAALAYGKVVKVRPSGVDRYGRILADVILPDGRNLNRELVREGMAWWFRRYSTDRVLQALEAEARSQRRGLWADKDPVPPWLYRKSRR